MSKCHQNTCEVKLAQYVQTHATVQTKVLLEISLYALNYELKAWNTPYLTTTCSRR